MTCQIFITFLELPQSIERLIMGNGIRLAADWLSNAKYEFGLMIK